MKDENKTKTEFIKELKTLKKEREKGVFKDIAESKEVEEELKDSEERLKILFDYAPDAYYISDLKGNFIDGNKAAERLVGYKREELIGKNFLKIKLLTLADIPRAAKVLAKSIMGQSTAPDEFELNRKDNSKVTVEISTYPVKIKGRTLVLGIARDITERKQAEETKHREELLSRSIVDNMPAGIAFLDNDFVLRWSNRAYAELIQAHTPYTGEQALGMSYFDYVVGSRPQVEEWFQKVRYTGQVDTRYGFDLVLEKDGLKKTTYWDTSVAPVPDIDGKVKGILILTQDVTERKQAEEALHKSEEKFRNYVETSQDLIWECDTKGRFTYLNPAWEQVTGYKLSEMLGKPFTDFTAKEEVEKNVAEFAKHLEGGFIKGYPSTYISKNGSEIALIFNAIPLYDFNKNIIGTQGSAYDNTERKQAEENLKNTKNELQMIIDSVPAIISYKDIESRIIRVNKTLANSLKIPVKDIIGKATEELFPKEQAEKMRKDDREVMISGKPKRDIIQPYTTPDGIRWLTTDKIPCKDKKGKVIGVIGLSKDITVQRKSEQKLQQTYKRLKKNMDATIDTMSRMIEAKDPYTSGHQHRVCQLAVPLAQELSLFEDKIEGIRIASLIHDIGKIGLPTEILSKPSKLNDIGYGLLKNHSQIGYDILKSIDFSYPIAQIVLQHHERLNGSGYPNNLKGDEIILEAKIIGVADVVEAISSHRPYRPALGTDKALEEIIQNRGTLYDPEVVNACLKLFKEKGFKFK